MADSKITKATVVNWALLELGVAPNFSIDEQTKLGTIVDVAWPRCEARCFGLHDWTALRRTSRLQRLEATPENGWPFGFQLPGDRRSGPLVLINDPQATFPIRDYTIEGDVVFTREQQLWIRVKVGRDPVTWDETFTDAFATALASYLAVPLLQDADMRDDKRAEAFGTPSEGGTGGKFGRLIAQDRAAAPISSPFQRFDPLTDAHG